MQTLVARDVPEEQKWGKRYFDLFRNPRGGPERLEHITPTFNELLLPGNTLNKHLFFQSVFRLCSLKFPILYGMYEE